MGGGRSEKDVLTTHMGCKDAPDSYRGAVLSFDNTTTPSLFLWLRNLLKAYKPQYPQANDFPMYFHGQAL